MTIISKNMFKNLIHTNKIMAELIMIIRGEVMDLINPEKHLTQSPINKEIYRDNLYNQGKVIN